MDITNLDRQKIKKYLKLFGFVFLFLGLIVAGFDTYNYFENNRLIENGEAVYVEGTVTYFDKEMVRETTPSGKRKYTTVCTVELEYTVADVLYEKEDDECLSLTSNSSIDLYYMVDNPDNYFYSETTETSAYLIWLWPGAALIATLVGFFMKEY